MRKSNRYKLVMALKARGFVFSEVVGCSKLWYCHKEYKGVICVIPRKVSNDTLALKLEDVANRLVWVKRNSLKVVSGGFAWVPNGLRIGTPRGKLKLVA